MATERVEIVVTERGSKVVKRNLRQIGTQATQSSKAVQLLRRALGLLGGALLIRQLIQMVDAFTNLRNRLKLVTDGTGELTVITKELFAISQRTRTSFDATGELYARVALATKALGISQQETLNFTESLNQAVILSGAASEEATAGIRQLSQGLASNRLSGDELRSVLEQLPLVADVIARRLGVTRGQLRILGEQGKITADIVLAAFKDAREELAERFADTIPTIGQAFTRLSSAASFLIGKLGQTSGISETLARSMIFLAKNLETILRLLGAAGLTGLLLLLPTIIGAVTAAVKALTLAIVRNPLGALLLVVTTAISLMVTFADKINLWTETFEDGTQVAVTFSDILTATFRGLSKLFERALVAVNGFFGGFSTGAGGVGQIAFTVVGTFRNMVNFVLKSAQGLVAAIVTAFIQIPKAIGDIVIQGFNGLISIVESGVNKIIDSLNIVREFFGADLLGAVDFGQTDNPFAGSAENFGKEVVEGFKKGFEADTILDILQKGIEGIFGPEIGGVIQERLGREIVRKAQEDFAKQQLQQEGVSKIQPKADPSQAKFKAFIAELTEENRLLGLNALERERGQVLLRLEQQLKRSLTDSERKQAEALLITNQRLQKQAEVLDAIQAPQVEFKRTTEALNNLFKDGKISIQEYQRAMLAAQKSALEVDISLQGGLQKGLLSIAEQFTDVASLAETTLVNAFQSAEDALVQFVQTGKVDFKSLVDSILADIIRLSIRQTITAPLAGLFQPSTPQQGGGTGGGFLDTLISGASGLFGGGTTGGGFLSGLSGLLGFQDGGRFTVGGSGGPDSQLVAFRASPGEDVEVTKPNGAPGGRQINVVFNIQTPDADSFQRNQGAILAKTQASLSRANTRNN